MTLPTREYLNSRLAYDPDTGDLRWKAKPVVTPHDKMWNVRYAGKPAGHYRRNDGYLSLKIDDKDFQAHRIIYCMMTGEWPPEVDHRDTDRTNNRWSNLRAATRPQNSRNCSVHRDNSTGLKGVVRQKDRYEARICVDGVTKSLGCYSTPEAAHAVYRAASAKLHGEFGRAA